MPENLTRDFLTASPCLFTGVQIQFHFIRRHTQFADWPADHLFRLQSIGVRNGFISRDKPDIAIRDLDDPSHHSRTVEKCTQNGLALSQSLSSPFSLRNIEVHPHKPKGFPSRSGIIPLRFAIREESALPGQPSFLAIGPQDAELSVKFSCLLGLLPSILHHLKVAGVDETEERVGASLRGTRGEAQKLKLSFVPDRFAGQQIQLERPQGTRLEHQSVPLLAAPEVVFRLLVFGYIRARDDGPSHTAVGVEQGHGRLDHMDMSAVGENQFYLHVGDRLSRGSGNLGRHLLGLQLHAIMEHLVRDCRFAGYGASGNVAGACRLHDHLVGIGIPRDDLAFRVMGNPDSDRGCIQDCLQFGCPLLDQRLQVSMSLPEVFLSFLACPVFLYFCKGSSDGRNQPLLESVLQDVILRSLSQDVYGTVFSYSTSYQNKRGIGAPLSCFGKRQCAIVSGKVIVGQDQIG